jgi:hypothetical protein
MMHLSDSVRNVPEVSRLFTAEVVALLEACFRSRFKIYSTTIYRLIPTGESMQASGLWHSDDFPPGVFKLIVYLTACDRQTGALRLHPRRRSRELHRRGFFSRYVATPYADLLDTGWHAVEGPAGTAVFFDARLVHRATPPVQGLRDVVSFTLLPSMEPWDRHFARVGAGLALEKRGRLIPDDPADD